MNRITLSFFDSNTTLMEGLAKPRNILIALGGFGASYFLYKTLKLYLRKRKLRHIPGPPTRGILGFYMGNLLEIRDHMKKGGVLSELMVEWHEKYGEVFKFQMFDRVTVLTSDKNSIKEILIVKNYPKVDSSAKRVGFPLGERFLGLGLVTDLDHERWKYRRAIFNPGFHRHVLVTFVNHFNQIVDNLSEKFRTVADGKTVIGLMNELNRATLDAIALIAFGMNTDAVNQKDSILNMYLSKMLKTIMQHFFDPLMPYRPSKYAEIKEFRKMNRYIRKIGKEKILERISAFKNNEHMADDILSSILASYKGDNLDIESMIDDFITFFVAGQETTANTLAFCFLEMGKNPDIVRKAREEIDRVLGQRTEVTYQDVTELKYCSAIFKESLRLFPPAPTIGRQIKDDMIINGHLLPANTNIFISTFVNGRYPKYFKDPLEFKPERFMKSATGESELENYIYLPFSLGPRNCIGQNFAQLEGIIVIAKLLQKFDFKLDPTQSFAFDQFLTLRPRDGTRCFITLRS